MLNALDNAGIFLVKIIFGLMVMLLLLRLLLQWHRANFHNPVCQLIGKLTNPVVVPLTKIIPKWNRLDTATLVLAIIVNFIQWVLLLLIHTGQLYLIGALPISIIDLVTQFLELLLYAIVAMIVISWLSPGVYNPVSEVLYSITEPMLRPIRRLIPPVSGFDISPIPAMIAIGVMIVILKSLI